MPKIKVAPISEVRANLAELVDEVGRTQQPCFVASRSKVKAVLLGIDQYEALMERLEDLEDSLDILRAAAEGESARPLEEFMLDLEAKRGFDVQRPA
jgi:prevent-host-death family protein